MYIYDICNETDKKLFSKCLQKLKRINDFKIKGEVLEDVDGTLIAEFEYQSSKVLLKNDEETGALYIESDSDKIGRAHV